MPVRYTSSKYKTLMVDGLQLKFADGAIQVSDPKHINRLDKLVGDPRFGITRTDVNKPSTEPKVEIDTSGKESSPEETTDVNKPSTEPKVEIDTSGKESSPEETTDVNKPSKADKREVWEVYAQSIDFDTDGLTKAQIIEAVG